MSQPIINPPNPYIGGLRVFPGTLVKVSGRPRPNAQRFAINFQTGPSVNPRDDVAIHVSPCFNPPRFVRNAIINSSWGVEESWGPPSSLQPGFPFEIMILAERDQFKIALNGVHYCEFGHRIPYAEITNLTIDGDVDLDKIEVISNPSSSAGQPMYHQTPYQPASAPYQPPVSSGAAQPPYPQFPPPGMPMPQAYPNLMPNQPVAHSSYPPPAPQAGGMPHANPYGAPPPAYPAPPNSQGGYQTGYPHLQPQPGHSQSSSTTSTPFGNLPIGGKALGTIAGALKQGLYKKFPIARGFI